MVDEEEDKAAEVVMSENRRLIRVPVLALRWEEAVVRGANGSEDISLLPKAHLHQTLRDPAGGRHRPHLLLTWTQLLLSTSCTSIRVYQSPDFLTQASCRPVCSFAGSCTEPNERCRIAEAIFTLLYGFRDGTSRSYLEYLEYLGS